MSGPPTLLHALEAVKPVGTDEPANLTLPLEVVQVRERLAEGDSIC